MKPLVRKSGDVSRSKEKVLGSKRLIEFWRKLIVGDFANLESIFPEKSNPGLSTNGIITRFLPLIAQRYGCDLRRLRIVASGPKSLEVTFPEGDGVDKDLWCCDVQVAIRFKGTADISNDPTREVGSVIDSTASSVRGVQGLPSIGVHSRMIESRLLPV